jgi:phosphohistidine phosphatase SixA
MQNVLLALFITIATHVGSIAASESDSAMTQAIKAVDANVIFMRHAIAPGYGDPNHFLVSDCKTQRNLNDVGRAQAIKIGQTILETGYPFTDILSSQWCRCKDTAALLNLGYWRTFEGLNSFFEGHVDKQTSLALLNKKLASIDDGLVLMVTHQVVISAVTNYFVGSGEFVAYNSKTLKAKAFALE